jgi:hypothetical protein
MLYCHHEELSDWILTNVTGNILEVGIFDGREIVCTLCSDFTIVFGDLLDVGYGSSHFFFRRKFSTPKDRILGWNIIGTLPISTQIGVRVVVTIAGQS